MAPLPNAEGQFKRTLCKFWLEGTCTKGELCTWSHAEEDAQRGGPSPQVPPQEKKTMCKFWLEGICKSGDSCTWAHGDHELGMPLSAVCRPMSAVSRPIGEPFRGNAGGKGAFARSPPQLFSAAASTPMHLGSFAGCQKGGFHKGAASSLPPKRTLCKFWMDGKCQAGDLCTWAHGEEDIGNSAPALHALPVGAAPQRAQPVKRTLCKFWVEGRCQAGDACTWAHGEDDIGEELSLDEEDAALEEDEELQDYLGEELSREDAVEMEEMFIDHPEAHGGVIKTKRTICKFWIDGKCQAGDRCTWAHGDDDIGTVVALEDPALVEDMGPTQMKRTLCKFWIEGKCQAGDTCTWAHGEEEVGVEVPVEAVFDDLRPPPWKSGGKLGPFSAAWKGGSAGPIGAPAAPPAAHATPEWMGPNAKRTMCKFWQLGACREGENCTYAHGDRDLSDGGGGSSSSHAGVSGGFLFPSLRPIASARVDVCQTVPQESVERRGIKRSMCKFWLENACSKGDLCTFAHGDEDLGALIPGDWLEQEPAPLIHRSATPCRFYAMGTCSKGASCTFAHVEAPDDRLPQAKRQRL